MRNRFIDYVDVFIGTTGNGHAIVGPQMPHGMVKLGPDTISLPCAGYDYSDDKIIGFSHTHMQGIGGRGGRGNILLTGITGNIKTDGREYASKYDHDNENAHVGYYQTVLKDYGVNVELTATEHAGFHRYTFPKAEKAYIILDVSHTLAYWYNCKESYIEVIDNHSIRGYGVYYIGSKGSSPYTVYFHAELDKPFMGYGIWNEDEIIYGENTQEGQKIGCFLDYSANEEIVVKAKVGLSYISMEKAKSNLDKEILDWDFEKTMNEAMDAWDKLLERIEVKGEKEEDKIKFYSALYRALNQPTDYTEYDYYHSGVSGKAQRYPSDGYHFYSDDWAIWDTFRTTHPLQTIVQPEIQKDIAQTFVRIFKQGGWLPMCTGPNLGYNQTMIGHNAAAVLADIYAKGFRGFDIEKAYEAMKKTAMEQHDDPSFKRLGTPELYKKLGYYPGGDEDTEEDSFSVSLTLELVYADWCTAQMAKALGKMDDYEYFIERSYNYINVFDNVTRFMRPKHRDGSWVEPFDPRDAFKNGFCETTSWEYTFFVPHDIQGLINLIGGNEAFIKRLDDFFEGGYYNYQNETGIQVPYLYNYAGAPWKTQETVRYYMDHRYKIDPAGLYAEDDAGAMSAWFVFSAMGLYPVCPGQNALTIGSPLFEEIIINNGSGGKFIIKADDNSEKNIYIKEAYIDEEPLNRVWITYDEIASGGILNLKMSNEPNKEWGNTYEAFPPSMTTDLPDFRYSDISIGSKKVETNVSFLISVDIENLGVIGGETVHVYANGQSIESKVVFLDEGEQKRVEFWCKLFEAGEYVIQVGDQIIDGVWVKGDVPPELEYLGHTELSTTMLEEGSNEIVKAIGWVKNIGSYIGKKNVDLYINDEPSMSSEVTILPGQTLELEFKFNLKHPGNYEIKIGDSAPANIDVATGIHSEWNTLSTTNAKYYQSGEHIYIKAAGFQSRPEFGILYLKGKVEGDFEIVTKISQEDNTSPYAPAGIIVKNDMLSIDQISGTVLLGAMSTRGYFFNGNTASENYSFPHRYAVGCPKVPYWLRLQKKDNVFSGSYSEDGTDWIMINTATVSDANDEQYVGLFVNAASPDMRMVKFDCFHVTNLGSVK